MARVGSERHRKKILDYYEYLNLAIGFKRSPCDTVGLNL